MREVASGSVDMFVIDNLKSTLAYHEGQIKIYICVAMLIIHERNAKSNGLGRYHYLRNIFIVPHGVAILVVVCVGFFCTPLTHGGWMGAKIRCVVSGLPHIP